MFSTVIQNYLSLCQKHDQKPFSGFVDHIHCNSLSVNLGDTTLRQVELLATAMCTPTPLERGKRRADANAPKKLGIPPGAHFVEVNLSVREGKKTRLPARRLPPNPNSPAYYYATHTGEELADPGRYPKVVPVLRLLLRGLHCVVEANAAAQCLRVFCLEGVPLYAVPHSSRLLLTSLCHRGQSVRELLFTRCLFYPPTTSHEPNSNSNKRNGSKEEGHLFMDLCLQSKSQTSVGPFLSYFSPPLRCFLFTNAACATSRR
ncbi:hypothetical protein ADEAN_000035400 [Angomonas deanei]|uniref:Uncharacterized protein n=1 Tax=Angomonas deanei TaxID=59799 RepID=A0A7G2BZG0_9TRYP|nr:hypothetical protein ADEAN_000035400 [Angomonas deanei]